jgi:nucleotide-binding universal stress UspA family protein
MQPSGKYIVAGVDGSETSLGAARWAASFARALGLPVHLVHSSPAPGAMPDAACTPAELAEKQRQYQTELLTTAEASLRQWAPEVELKLVADTESPAKGLVEAAAQGAMIVLGATGAGSVESWLLGSTALRVADNAHCPVAIWRGDPDNATLDNRPIVVGTDGSPASEAATDLAFEWAQLLSVTVVPLRTWTDSSVVGAAMPTAMQLLGPTGLMVDWEEIARAEAETLSKIIAPYLKQYPDAVVQPLSRRGSAARELLHALDDAQMAIVGSRGWGRFRGALLGSTSQNLLHRADRPIVIYRTTDT